MEAEMPEKCVVVTGAGGFLGFHFAQQILAQGKPLRVLVHHEKDALRFSGKAAEIWVGSVSDAALMHQLLKDAHLVYHFAACTQEASHREYLDTNVSGTLNILHAALAHDAQVIYLSSHEVYGRSLYLLLDEQHPLLGQSAYISSRIAADMLAESFAKSFQHAVTIVRLFPVLAPQDTHLLRNNEDSHEELLEIDVLSLSDVLKALPLIAENVLLHGKVLNLSSGQLQKLSRHECSPKLKSWAGRLGSSHLLQSSICWQPTPILSLQSS